MRDGKIARIEYIEEERRKQAVAELGQSKAVQNMKSRQTNTESTESAPKAKIDMKSAQFTEVREPYDYDFLQSRFEFPYVSEYKEGLKAY
mmetsp:Transcript_43402/g.112913  ORF Transcript_43402/g.112913 Transcript_43402/m.112913 type:complete len:90 (+) Transcript_43402:188-457(+)